MEWRAHVDHRSTTTKESVGLQANKEAVVHWEDLEKTAESSIEPLGDVPIPYRRKGRAGREIRIRKISVFPKTVACLV